MGSGSRDAIISLLKVLESDLAANGVRSSSRVRLLVSTLTQYSVTSSVRIVVRLRLAQHLYRSESRIVRIMGHYFNGRNQREGVHISVKCGIGPGLRLAHPVGIVIGDDVHIGSGAQILQNVTIGGANGRVRSDDPTFTMPRMGSGVLVGAGAVVVGPVIVDDDSKIPANAVVVRDWPPSDPDAAVKR